jgi:N-acetylmuramoyl-L-alanine amidase
MNGIERRSTGIRVGVLALGLLLVAGAAPAIAQSAKTRYERALARETTLRQRLDSREDLSAAERRRLLRDVAQLVAAYEYIPRRYPTTGYADNALWQAARLSESAYRRFGSADDRTKALQLYRWLVREYPSSSLVRRARTQMGAVESLESVEASLPAATTPAPPPARRPEPAPAVSVPTPVMSAAPPADAPPSMSAVGAVKLHGIQRSVLPGSVRVTLELEREVPYREERIQNPDRVFFDLKGVQLAPHLVDKVISYSDDIVRQIRTGRHPDETVRVVLDLAGVSRYSVFTLYNPYRLVIDFERVTAGPARRAMVTPPTEVANDTGAVASAAPTGSEPAAAPAPTTSDPESGSAPAPVTAAAAPGSTAPAALPSAPAAERPVPAAPSSNGSGGFSLSRQLGLGVSRIVIDPGHGGHDPGTHVHGLEEADLTLDVALRLEKLLENEDGIEVILTRRTDVYVPLEERTAIANREGADLFLSIHANASRNPASSGIETYYLSFASSPEAEAVAARENSSSESAMHNLPDIIKAIALNNKLDESRDLAAMVQESMVTRLRRTNKAVRNRGVKKAPFVVLIGAGMPSVLAEISFLTNRQEARLLKTTAYKQRIAESLHEAVIKYRRSLKRQSTVADRP